MVQRLLLGISFWTLQGRTVEADKQTATAFQCFELAPQLSPRVALYHCIVIKQDGIPCGICTFWIWLDYMAWKQRLGHKLSYDCNEKAGKNKS